MGDAEGFDDARRAGVATRIARAFAAGGAGRLVRALLEFEPLGWALLRDRAGDPDDPRPLAGVLAGPGGVVVVDVLPPHGAEVRAAAVRLAAIVERAQGALAEIGLAPGEVRGVLALPGPARGRAELAGVVILDEAAAVLELAGLGRRLDPELVAALRPHVARVFPAVPPGLPGVVATGEPDPAAASGGRLLDPEHVLAALDEAAAHPAVEDWMVLLEPEQARIVHRRFDGPARLRGPAGTGKTVVALHRAAHLARRTGGRVLLTCDGEALPELLRSLVGRLAPDVADRVDVLGVHGFAARVLAERGGSDPVDPSPGYWREEVLAVIKGRGLVRFEEYAALPRRGRRRPLDAAARAEVWDLYVAYDRALRRHGIMDHADLLIEAEASLRLTPLDRYQAVVVDEAQDLSCVALRMLHGLVGDRPDGLFLVGDERQAISPGGFGPDESGIRVAGRTVSLSVDHRSTAEIAAYARLFLTGEEPDAAGDPPVTTRTGARPVVTVFPSRAVHDRSLIERVRRLVAEPPPGARPLRYRDVGVLALSGWHAREAAAVLETAGIPTVGLGAATGELPDAVRVGTVRGAKGLGFAEVLVVRTPPHLVRRVEPPANDAARERMELQRRALHVAMSRARDGLWVGVA